MFLLSFISTRSMAVRPPWLSLKTRSFVTKGVLLYYHLPEMLSFTSLLALLQYQQLLVHFAFRIRCALCRRLGCGGGAKALPGQLQCPLRCLLQRQLLLRVGGLRRTGHHQHILAARLVGLVVLHRLAEGSLPDILVQLCQLPAQGDAAVCAKGIGQIVQRGAQLVGRFVKDGGCLLYTSPSPRDS